VKRRQCSTGSLWRAVSLYMTENFAIRCKLVA